MMETLTVVREAFNGTHVAANFVRLFIIFVGFTLALVGLKLAYNALRRGETERFWGIASFTLVAVTPSITGLFRFGAPLTYETTIPYVLGLACGVVALAYRVSVSPPWLHFWTQRRRRGGLS